MAYLLQNMDTTSQLKCELVLVVWLYDVKKVGMGLQVVSLPIDTLDFCPFLAYHAGI